MPQYLQEHHAHHHHVTPVSGGTPLPNNPHGKTFGSPETYAPFTDYVARWRTVVDTALAAQAGTSVDLGLNATSGIGLSPGTNATSHLNTPSDLSAYLYSPLASFVEAGGKRIRPILCLLGCEAVGGEPTAALPVALAIENFQSAALIHDDIADKGTLRRGKPCLYLTEGLGPAINVGDLALVRVTDSVLQARELAEHTRLNVLVELNSMMLRTLEGQALDLGWVRDDRWDLTPHDYRRMAILKTAHYSASSPLVLGAIIGGAAQSQLEDLRTIGLDAGLAFQLQDDLLNLVEDAQYQGKDWRTDITEGKRTLIALVALERLQGAARKELLSILRSHEDDPVALERAVRLMEEAGALDAVRNEARELADRALERIQAAAISESSRTILAAMTHYFVSRVS